MIDTPNCSSCLVKCFLTRMHFLYFVIRMNNFCVVQKPPFLAFPGAALARDWPLLFVAKYKRLPGMLVKHAWHNSRLQELKKRQHVLFWISASHKPLSAKRAKHHVFRRPRPFSRLPPACRVIDMWLFCCTMDPFICGLETHDDVIGMTTTVFRAGLYFRLDRLDHRRSTMVCPLSPCQHDCPQKVMYLPVCTVTMSAAPTSACTFAATNRVLFCWRLKLVVIVGVYLFMMQLNDSHDS